MIRQTSERGNFLNEEQKALKQKIMEDCIESLFGNLKKNQCLFPLDDTGTQALFDMIFSVLVMFNREVLFHFLKSTGEFKNRKQLLNNLFSAVKDEIDRKYRETLI